MKLPKAFKRKFSNLYNVFIFILGLLILFLIPFFKLQNSEWDNTITNILSNISAALLTVALIFMLQRLLYVDENEEFRSEVTQNIEIMNENLSNLGRALDIKTRLSAITIIDYPCVYTYKFKSRKINQIIGLVKADITDIKFIDIWVNSENTNMQMSRFYEKTISGIIRYQGAVKDERNQRILKDIIHDELSAQVDVNIPVPAHTVLVTSAGELEKTHNVKRIFHVAAVQGQVKEGYSPVKNIGKCVENALEMANSSEYAQENLTSILFPLFGAGQAGGDLQNTAKQLIDAAIRFIDVHPLNSFKAIYFLTVKERDANACRQILENSDVLEFSKKEKLKL